MKPTAVVASASTGKTDREQPTSHHPVSIAVESPIDGRIVGRVVDSTADDVAGAVELARNAQPLWAETGFKGRAQAMRSFSDALLDSQEEFLDLLVSETGKTRRDAFAETMYVVDTVSYYAKHAEKFLQDRTPSAHSPILKTKALKTIYRPMGVVGIIGPWNFPVILSVGDAIPALMAGNTVVIKPATLTPLTVEWICDLFRRVTGMDALVCVTGRGSAVGNILIDRCDFIGFTGSTAVGKKVMARAAKTVTPVSLELGGKDAMIVFADANIERAVGGAAMGGLFNAGQVCMSVERIYVEEPVYDEFVDKLVDKVGSLSQGAGEWDVDVGLMTSQEQADTVDRQVKEAVGRGARVLAGGKFNPREGRLAYEPTILVDVDHGMEVMREETFGPLLPIMKVRDEDEAVRLANDSQYGLSGSVWTRDKARGERVARRLDTGSVCINDALMNYFATEIPFGGWKESGIGMRHGGADGIRKYCRTESLFIDRPGLDNEFLWYPASKLKARLLRSAVRALYGTGWRSKLGLGGKDHK